MIGEVTNLSQQGFNCAQIVLDCVSKEIGIDSQLARKLGSCFGGGMSCGEVCGAVTGALMAIGLRYGSCLPNTPDVKRQCTERHLEFRKKFLEEYDSLLCRDLLGYDISNPEETKIVMEKGLFLSFCSGVVEYSIEVLKGIL